MKKTMRAMGTAGLTAIRTAWLAVLAAAVLGMAESGCSKQVSEEAQARQYMNARIAEDAMTKGSFVVETDRIVLKRGNTLSVSPATNYFAVNDGKATLQISTNSALPGQNGLGGITVRGTLQKLKETASKNGTVHRTYMLSGSGVTAHVNITLPAGSDRATVDVDGVFSSSRMTMYGRVVPYEGALLIEGRPL